LKERDEESYAPHPYNAGKAKTARRSVEWYGKKYAQRVIPLRKLAKSGTIYRRVMLEEFDEGSTTRGTSLKRCSAWRNGWPVIRIAAGVIGLGTRRVSCGKCVIIFTAVGHFYAGGEGFLQSCSIMIIPSLNIDFELKYSR